MLHMLHMLATIGIFAQYEMFYFLSNMLMALLSVFTEYQISLPC